MNKASIICKSCNADNIPNSEYCIECGTTLNSNNTKMASDNSENEKFMSQYRNWKRSVPYTISAVIFITLIDLFTSGGTLQWSYWASVPIILFAVISPYFSYKFGE